MDYESAIVTLLATREELEVKQSEISDQLRRIEDDIQTLKREQTEHTISDLSDEEEIWVRDELTVVGKLLCGEDVIFGGLDLVYTDPDEMNTSGYTGTKHSKKFSIGITVSICTEFKASLRCTIVVKTKSQKIEAIVREMFHSSEDSSHSINPCRRNWCIDWDYYNSIQLKNPFVHPDGKLKSR